MDQEEYEDYLREQKQTHEHYARTHPKEAREYQRKNHPNRDDRDYNREMQKRGREERREGRIQDRTEINKRTMREREKINRERADFKSREKAAEKNRKAMDKDIQRRKDKPTNDERIEGYNQLSPWQKYKQRKSPAARHARIAEKELKQKEGFLDNKIRANKVMKNKLRSGGGLGSMFGNSKTKATRKAGRSSRDTGRRSTFGSYDSRGTIFDNSGVGHGLGDMFGNTKRDGNTGKRKDSGIDGLRKMFG